MRLAHFGIMTACLLSVRASADPERPLALSGTRITRSVVRCANTESRAAERSKASPHYKRGVQLYEQGDYESAIAEFATAYCHVPDPLMLRNIAQSFERQADYEKALAFLERYIAELDDAKGAERKRAEFRLTVLKRLPARIAVASNPPGAKVTLRSDAGVIARGLADAKESLLVTRGRYTMSVELPGHATTRRTIEVGIGGSYSFIVELPVLKGTLRVAATPSSARIFLDRKLVGIGSYVENIGVGTYEVMVEDPDRTSTTRKVTVAANKTVEVRLELEKPSRSGRLELVAGSTLAGGVFGGFAAAAVFAEEDTALLLAGSLGGLGLGFAGGYFGIPKEVSVGSANFIIGSTAVLATEVGLIATLGRCSRIEQDDGTFRASCSDRDYQVIAGAALGASMVGAIVSSVVANKYELSSGDVGLVWSGAIWGSVTAALFYSAFDDDARLQEPMLLAGLNLGMLATGLLARRIEISRGRTALIDLAGLGGLLAGSATGLAIAGDQSERVDHMALLGMAGGLISGAFLTRFMDEPSSKGLGNLSASAVPARDVRGKTTLVVGASGAF